MMSAIAVSDTARIAEDLGYAVLGCSDHLDAQLAPLLLLSAAAAVTTQLELQPLVLANDFRHPVVLAKEAATLDVLSGGRFALGLGAGWLGADFKTSGIPFHPPRVRIQRVAETVAIFKGLQREQPFSFQGEHYQVNALVGEPKPARAPIPIMLAGSGRMMLSLAARVADTVALNPGLPISAGRWQTGPTPYADITDTKLDWIKTAAGERFTRLQLQTTIFGGAISSKDPEQVLAPLATYMGTSADRLIGCPHVLAGDVDQCIDSILAWRERWGVSYISLPATLARDFAPIVAALSGK
jgi:probable F420-dependent oxidoreductase